MGLGRVLVSSLRLGPFGHTLCKHILGPLPSKRKGPNLLCTFSQLCTTPPVTWSPRSASAWTSWLRWLPMASCWSKSCRVLGMFNSNVILCAHLVYVEPIRPVFSQHLLALDPIFRSDNFCDPPTPLVIVQLLQNTQSISACNINAPVNLYLSHHTKWFIEVCHLLMAMNH